MASVVVGIFPNHDALTRLTESLKSNGLDIGRLEVISPETPATELVETGVRFTYVGDDDAVIGRGEGIITSGGGTSVPGLSSYNPTPRISSDDTIERLLGDLEIPDSRFDTYSLEIERGKTVAGYPAPGGEEKVKDLFAAAGANPVEVF